MPFPPLAIVEQETGDGVKSTTPMSIGLIFKGGVLTMQGGLKQIAWLASPVASLSIASGAAALHPAPITPTTTPKTAVPIIPRTVILFPPVERLTVLARHVP